MSKCRNCGAEIAQGDRFCQECGADQQESKAASLMTIGGLETLDTGDVRPRGRDAMPDLEPGTEFSGRYLIESVVGKGGMGVVYRAHDKLADKTVALKLIRADRLAGQGAVRRLISEGITTRDIRHPNIVAVYDVGDAAGQPFVSMEFIKGQSLRDWHRDRIRQRKDVPLRVAARIIAEVLDGLAAAHAAGVIHRDLKPENIMLTDEPTEAAAPLKILDFGIARATTGATDSNTGTGLGTPRYMAPEQVTAADSAGPEADIYSLSVIFYELLVDVLPQGHWQAPSGGRSDVPTSIDVLIERGLSNRPANRPQTAKEYRKLLVDAVNLGVVYRTEEKQDGSRSTLFNKNSIIWGGASVAAICVIAITAAVAGSGGDVVHGQGEGEIAGGGGSFSPQPVKTSAYSQLSGQWDDGLGSLYSVRVNNNGAFSGTGQNSYGYGLQISGRLNGSSGDFNLAVPSVGATFAGRLQWDQGCHISFQTYDMSGTLVGQGQMHVNHTPGGPCPS
ncbi:protein kinase [Hyphomonas sp. WL0036]|uniref:serine/threonine-protein kinase n=1 Tax=Hyphomonas sediminis TaxID=2866160 RepID=UPI001C80FB2B|nr:serine/threonine-protein kinase [Hyphomonas sediminis]MBY9067482.1 protein kinase [Hyphomonas sediminis]